MTERQTPPPPDHEDKPVAENSKAEIGERLTGKADPQDPDGLLTLDDVDKVAGTQDRIADDASRGVSAAGAAPSGDIPERVVGGDAPSIGSLNSGGDSMGDDAGLPGAEESGAETP
ncbi:hypothetical protein [Naasia sp. SYSU D00057]|uniref:hypothetical protein n=1 Tax=Naasia sp. SYSU D00057 TaxID=2817380 RepID=UPI001B31624E|nr:hypothetical protein [Naasia sp. SYSU D00057]